MTTAPQDLDPQLNPKYNFDNYFEYEQQAGSYGG